MNPLHSMMLVAIRKHALANYEKGWDVIVEAWTDDEILEVIASETTIAGALACLARRVNLYNDVCADVRAEIF